jgi:hypothetical protein
MVALVACGVVVTEVAAGSVGVIADSAVEVGTTVGRGDAELHPSISQPTNNSRLIRAEIIVESIRRIRKATSHFVLREFFLLIRV